MTRIASSIALLVLAAVSAPAQSISGIIHQRASQRPFSGVKVELWSDDSAVNVSRTATSDSSGIFAFLSLPAAHYHLEFYSGHELLGAAGPYLVAADSDVQRAYSLDLPDTARRSVDGDRVYSIFEVQRAARPLHSNRPLAFPRELAAQGVHGAVTMQFVVDQSGSVVPTSLRTIRSDDPRLTEAMRTALLQMRFAPAEIDGQKVKQIVRQTINYALGEPSSMSTPP